MEYKERWIYKLCQYSWAFLIPVLILLWVLVWKLPEFTLHSTEMAVIGSTVAVTGLAAIMYLYSVHTKELANVIREQAEASRKLAEISEKSVVQSQEQARQMLRPVVIPEIIQLDEEAWESWHGKLIIRNGGNGPAIQLKLKTLLGESTVAWQKELPVLLTGQSDLSDITLSFPPQLATSAVGNGTKVEYNLEIGWSSPYEKGFAKCILPFTLIIDAKGHPTISVSALDFKWADIPIIRTG